MKKTTTDDNQTTESEKSFIFNEKTNRVDSIFSSIVNRYTLMNDIMSLGSHRLLKRSFIDFSEIHPKSRVLDLAAGTGDITLLLADNIQPPIVLADQNYEMLEFARDRLLDKGHHQLHYVQTSAESLPFEDNSFDNVLISFGLRNFTDLPTALKEIYRILSPNGVLSILEFSKPTNPLINSAYRSFQSLWPSIGKFVVGSSEPYNYLVESIEQHPNQNTLQTLISEHFINTNYTNLLNGIVAIHKGYKPSSDS